MTDKKKSTKSPSVEPHAPSHSQTLANGDLRVDTQPKSGVDATLPFKTLGRYKVLKELGRGGMGAVYLAEDTVLKRQVALKIPQFEASKAEQMRARFEREAQMAAQLSHPNICQVYDVAEIDGRLAVPYYSPRSGRNSNGGGRFAEGFCSSNVVK